ncbi:MAG: CRISPR-associated protein Cas4 [Thermoplasmata archaeon]|nr:CRISPR-associated protein Cas4 [Thermoplasmata archaeon]
MGESTPNKASSEGGEAPREKSIAFISAGDMEKYAYCPLSWWLSRETEVVREDTLRGVEEHGILERKLDTVDMKVAGAKGYERAVFWTAILATILSIAGAALIADTKESEGFILAFLSLVWLLAASYFLYRAETMRRMGEKGRGAEAIITVFSVVAMLLALFAVVFVLPSDSSFPFYLETLSLMWLVGASLFLYLNLSLTQEAADAKISAGISEGEIVYHDSSSKTPPLLVSKKYGIRGRPDYLLRKEEGLVPVEVKTGRIPRGPLFSHIIQVSAYCLLVEETYGETPPYGVIRYQRDGQRVEHEIEYTPEMKKLVLDKVEEMRRSMETGEVHRNHRKENKCRHCSRRSVCPERLV